MSAKPKECIFCGGDHAHLHCLRLLRVEFKDDDTYREKALAIKAVEFYKPKELAPKETVAVGGVSMTRGYIEKRAEIFDKAQKGEL